MTDHVLEDASTLTLAQKIDRLFRTMHPTDRGEFTYREVADGVRAMQQALGDDEGSISPSYVCQLRTGRRTNPTVKQLQLLARFFKVPMTYFVGQPEEIEAIDTQMALIGALRDQNVRDIVLRVSGLTPLGVQAVSDVIASLEKAPGMTRRRTRSHPGRDDPPGLHPTLGA